MIREEIKEGLRFTVDMFKFDPLTGRGRTLNELDVTTVNACEEAIKVIDDFEALNAINLDLADENEDLVERIGKLIGYIDFLRNTAQGKKKSLNLLEKVVKGELEEIRAEGENFVKPRTGEWIPITERLPEEMFGCLVTVWDANPKTGEEFENILPEFAGYDGETWNGADGKPIAFEVVAWMPLPEPYKEDKE